MKTLAPIVLGIALLTTALTVSATPPLLSPDEGESSWAHGEITAGPGTGETGWATNTDGTHDSQECGALVSAVPLPGFAVTADPTLAFTHGYEMQQEAWTGVANDAATVILSTDGGDTWTWVPNAGYSVPTYSGAVNACFDGYGVSAGSVYGGSQGLQATEVDLSELVEPTDTVTVGFLFASDGTFEMHGWAITEASLAGIPLTLDELPAIPTP